MHTKDIGFITSNASWLLVGRCTGKVREGVELCGCRGGDGSMGRRGGGGRYSNSSSLHFSDSTSMQHLHLISSNHQMKYRMPLPSESSFIPPSHSHLHRRSHHWPRR